MNPQSHVVPLAKHLSQKRTLNDEPWVACWTGIYKKESIAFAVKTACTVFIGVGVLRGRPWGGGDIVCCSLADVNSMWRPGSAADWQTVPLQSAANQPVSNTRRYRGHNVQSAAPPVTPCCFAFRLSRRALRRTPSSVNMPKQSERVYLCENLERAQLHSGRKGDWCSKW